MKLLKISEVAEILSVSDWQVRQLIAKKCLMPIDVGAPCSGRSTIRLTMESVESFIESRKPAQHAKSVRKKIPSVKQYV